MSGTCKDCVHWRKNVEPSVLARSSSCLRVETSGAYATGLSHGTKAIVTTGLLKTGPDFGCNQFESKNKNLS